MSLRDELEKVLRKTKAVVADAQGLLIAADPELGDKAHEIAAYLPIVGFEAAGLFFSHPEVAEHVIKLLGGGL